MTDSPLTVIDPNKPVPRAAEDVVAMGAAVQANVVQMRNAECKRQGKKVMSHDIKVLSPGSVIRFRESLIDWRAIKGYTEAELHLRLHESWGQYCLLCWLWEFPDAHTAPGFGAMPEGRELKCQSAIEMKVTEVSGHLWTLRFEQRKRHERGFVDGDDFAGMQKLAEMIPVKVFGQSAAESDDHALLLASCELVGMLAAARWAFDTKWAWNQQGIMDVDDAFFEEIARQA